MNIERFPFGTFYNQSVSRIVLSNENGLSVSILDLGGIITNLYVPDNLGKMQDVVLGFDNITDYIKHDNHYFGALIGRVANRIEGAKFELNGETVQVQGNAYNGRHCVHGGRFGYHRRVWQLYKTEKTDNHISVTFLLNDNDGEEGFRYSVKVFATYALTRDNKLCLTFNASSDGPTPVSMTGHSYFNLFGHSHGSIEEHRLTLFSHQYLSQREDRLPDGKLMHVDRTIFDYRDSKSLKGCIENRHEINHSYVFEDRATPLACLHKMACLEGAGRRLTVYSNERTLHLYNGHNLDGIRGKDDACYHRYSGICFEPKGYVNGVNQHNFPCTIIDRDNCYMHKIVYDFNQ